MTTPRADRAEVTLAQQSATHLAVGSPVGGGGGRRGGWYSAGTAQVMDVARHPSCQSGRMGCLWATE